MGWRGQVGSAQADPQAVGSAGWLTFVHQPLQSARSHGLPDGTASETMGPLYSSFMLISDRVYVLAHRSTGSFEPNQLHLAANPTLALGAQLSFLFFGRERVESGDRAL